jgi:DNA-directed RNA polymerase specialized sigma24 family protein
MLRSHALAMVTARSDDAPQHPPRRARWRLTGDAFACLLARLDPDPQRAGEQYEILRRALIVFFRGRGCEQCEELSDETLDRVARRLGDGAQIDDPARFAYGVALRVWQESWRRPVVRPLETVRALAAAPVADDGREDECLARCLARLPAQDRSLILGYYAFDKREKIDHRARLARELGLALTGLRTRAHRIRAALESCLRACVASPRGPRPAEESNA